MSQPPFQISKISTQAKKFIAKRDRKIQKEIADALDYLVVSPFHHPNPKTITRLHGNLEGFLRFRIGKVRIIYTVDVKERRIEIITIDDRGDVYK